VMKDLGLCCKDDRRRWEDGINGSVANLAGGGIPGIWTPVG
jgi:hypothetical protein